MPGGTCLLACNLELSQSHTCRTGTVRKTVLDEETRCMQDVRVHSDVFDQMTRGCFVDFALSHDLPQATGFGQAWR
jgi:hypothetical protein